VIVTDRPVAGIPTNGPRWVPVARHRVSDLVTFAKLVEDLDGEVGEGLMGG
jgi:hypothetical protein